MEERFGSPVTSNETPNSAVKRVSFGYKLREELTFDEANTMLLFSRGAMADMIDIAFEFGDLSARVRDVLYDRKINWLSLQEIGKKQGVTRERIRQIEAKAEEILRHLTRLKTA